MVGEECTAEEMVKGKNVVNLVLVFFRRRRGEERRGEGNYST